MYLALNKSSQGISKNPCYETPYYITGIVVVTGPQVAPKVICTDRKEGTWKAGNEEAVLIQSCYVV